MQQFRFSIRDKVFRITNHKSTYIRLYTHLKSQRATLQNVYNDLNNQINKIEQKQKENPEQDKKDTNQEKELNELKNVFHFLKKLLKYDLCSLILNSPRHMAKLSKDFLHSPQEGLHNIMISSNSSLSFTSNLMRSSKSKDHSTSSMPLSKIINIIESSCVFFVKFQSMLLSSFKYNQNNKNSVPMGAMLLNNATDNKVNHTNTTDNDNNNSNAPTEEVTDTLICRLCNEHINADLFDEHIKSCAIAFKSDLKLKDINASLSDQIEQIRQHFISTEWPGDLHDATTIVLPMLHVAILLKQAKEVDANTPEGLEELEDIELALFQIPISELEDEKMKIHDDESNGPTRSRKRFQTVSLTSTSLFFNRAIYMSSVSMIQDKIKVSVALNSASSVLKNTRISGSDRVCEIVKITDFILIKKISAGAFARVFLAQMKKTGDIFAMKVTPKSSLKHKNEVSRIIIEKNIMLNFNSTYIVNFCMYFF